MTISSELLISQYHNTYTAIKSLSIGMTHEDSLLQFPFGGNCLNWTMGHVTVSRLNLLAMLGYREPIWAFSEARRYIPGSEPVTDASTDITRFEKILVAYDRSHEQMVYQLQQSTPELLTAVPPHESQTLGETLAYYAQHEAYHAGQLELFRLLAGKGSVPGFE
jgi:hypothetical protein